MIETYAPTFIVEINGKELPEDITQHVESFSYEDHEDKMDELRISIVRGGLEFVDHPQLQEGNDVRVRWGYLGNMSPMHICTIKEISYTFSEEGIARMEVSAFDKRHKLTGRSARTCWKDVKVADIVNHIAKKHNLTPKLEIPEDITREFASQGGKSDMIYLSELAREMGCSMWVENDELHFKPNKIAEPVLKFRWREDKDGYLQSFRITSKAEQGKGTGRETELAGLDPMTKEKIKATRTAAEDAKEHGATISLEEGRELGETPPKARDDETGNVHATPAPNAGHARRVGRGKVRTAAMQSVEATATTIGLPYLKAKDAVTIENIGTKFSGQWRVKRVKHSISRSGYTCDLTLCKDSYTKGGKGAKQAAGTPPKTAKNNANTAKAAGEGKKKNVPASMKIDVEKGKSVS